MNRYRVAVAVAGLIVVLGLGACAEERKPQVAPKGEPTSVRTDVLRGGAASMQTYAPVNGMNVYLVGFHPMKAQPQHQMDAHHFCRQVNEDFAQCTLFDGNTTDANLTGVKFIISEKLFETLPETSEITGTRTTAKSSRVSSLRPVSRISRKRSSCAPR